MKLPRQLMFLAPSLQLQLILSLIMACRPFRIIWTHYNILQLRRKIDSIQTEWTLVVYIAENQQTSSPNHNLQRWLILHRGLLWFHQQRHLRGSPPISLPFLLPAFLLCKQQFLNRGWNFRNLHQDWWPRNLCLNSSLQEQLLAQNQKENSSYRNAPMNASKTNTGQQYWTESINLNHLVQ